MAVEEAGGWMLENGYAEKSAGYLKAVLKQFQNHAQKVTRLLQFRYWENNSSILITFT